MSKKNKITKKSKPVEKPKPADDVQAREQADMSAKKDAEGKAWVGVKNLKLSAEQKQKQIEKEIHPKKKEILTKQLGNLKGELENAEKSAAQKSQAVKDTAEKKCPWPDKKSQPCPHIDNSKNCPWITYKKCPNRYDRQ